MKSDPVLTPMYRARQFSLWSLLELLTISAVLFALSPTLGMAASIALMLLSLAILARQGIVAMSMLMASLMTTDVLHHLPSDGSAYGREILVVLITAGLCIWHTNQPTRNFWITMFPRILKGRLTSRKSDFPTSSVLGPP